MTDFVYEFEQKLCDYTKALYCLAVDCCSHAIFLSLKLFNTSIIKCPKNTYFSVPMQIIHSGHKLQFIKNEWYNLYKLEPTNIYDCAIYFQKDMYIKDSIMCLSFQYKKSLFVNRGGAILLDNKEQYEKLKELRYDGRDLSIPVREITNIKTLGYHYYMTPESAAQGLLSFNRQINCNLHSYLDYQDVSNFDCFKPYLYYDKQ